MKILKNLAVISVGLIVIGCGKTTSGVPQPATEEGLKTAVQEYSEALFGQKVKTAYKFLTAECQEKVTLGDFTGQVFFGMAFLEGFAEVKAEDFVVGEIEIRNFTDSSAETRNELLTTDGLVFSSLEDSSWSEWKYEGGGWRSTDCEEMIGVDGSSSDGGSSSYPSCDLLKEGGPIPDEFQDDSDAGFTLDCEGDDQISISFRMTCFFSDREYVSNDIGYAFLDDPVFRKGDVAGCLPACTELVDGQPVPDAFSDNSRIGFNLNCETPAGDEMSIEWQCFDSDREYVMSERGYAFPDDRIFRSGEAPTC